MYEPGTILTLKEPREPDEETGVPFPYNEVRVVGPSPVSHSSAGEWSGAAAGGVIITPNGESFGSTLDEPLGKLQSLYDVKEIPVREIGEQKVRIINSSTASAGPTPEEVFAKEAPGEPPEEGQKRARTSPLEDPRPAPGSGPLDVA